MIQFELPVIIHHQERISRKGAKAQRKHARLRISQPLGVFAPLREPVFVFAMFKTESLLSIHSL
jgi:hypothetical protein